ncbi:esterase [Ilyonectria robusta]|uniref:esterase n=1 Tax=Ilyonectria robusta TaxID=1079257 RepID=UPI001E8E71AE|nr:esterase [Ilyonectria robusta]KAH8663234.1 esterase [Ilyonectria robusta]
MAPNALQKALRLVFVAPFELSASLALAIVHGLVPRSRPDETWTLRQAFTIAMFRGLIRQISALQRPAGLNLRPGSEGDRFVVMSPVSQELYRGPMEDPLITPGQVGATWTPKPLKSPTSLNQKWGSDLLVVMHLHGGAYVVGDGRDNDTGFTAKTLLSHMGCSHVFTPQYRLSSNPRGRFPAALQDALSSYVYLLHHLQIPPSQIVLSGDSAGANLALGLLRYISEFGTELDLPWPGAVTLWSPWSDVSIALDPAKITQSPNYRSDYLDPSFPCWGAYALIGDGQVGMTDPYISPPYKPFKIEAPVWVHTGGREVLFHDNLRLVDEFRRAGTSIEWVIAEHCPHDIILVGKSMGFEEEAAEGSRKAGEFVRLNQRNRASLAGK